MNNSAIVKKFKNLENYYPPYRVSIIPDVYSANQSGLESYSETMTEFYENLRDRRGLKKLNNGNYDESFRVSYYFIDKILRWTKRGEIHVSVFFIEDRKNKDFIPIISVFTRKDGLIGSYVIARRNDNAVIMTILATFKATSKYFYKLDDSLFD